MADTPKFIDPEKNTISGAMVSKLSNSAAAVIDSDKLDPKQRLNLPHDKPIVMLFGPGNAGKTAILGSLIAYTTNKLSVGKRTIPTRHTFEWTVLHDVAAKNSSLYKGKTSELLLKIHRNEKYIGSTNDLFLLNAKFKGRPAFIALEIPGEYYYSESTKTLCSELFIADLVERDQKKVYFFIFSPGLFGNDPDKMQVYDIAVAKFIDTRLVRGRDKFSLVYTKVKDDSSKEAGVSELECAINAFKPGGAFSKTGDAYRNSPIKGKKIIPYHSGVFTHDAMTNDEVWAPAAATYAKTLTENLVDLVRGKPWWKFW